MNRGKFKVAIPLESNIYFLYTEDKNLSDVQSDLVFSTKYMHQVKVMQVTDRLFYMRKRNSFAQDLNLSFEGQSSRTGPFLISHNDIREGPTWLNGPEFKKQAIVCAHRGYFRKPGVPENSILAFEYAIFEAAKRDIDLDMLELDFRKTKDKRHVLFHDQNGLNRATNIYKDKYLPNSKDFLGSVPKKLNKSLKDLDFNTIHQLEARDNFWNVVDYINFESIETVFRYFSERQTKSAEETIKSVFGQSTFDQMKKYHPQLFETGPSNPFKDAVDRTANGTKVMISLDKIAIRSYFVKYIEYVEANYPNMLGWILYKDRIHLESTGNNNQFEVKGWENFKKELIAKNLLEKIIYSPIVTGMTAFSSKKMTDEISNKTFNTVINNFLAEEQGGLFIPAYELFSFNQRGMKRLLRNQFKFKYVIEDHGVLDVNNTPSIGTYFKTDSDYYQKKMVRATMLGLLIDPNSEAEPVNNGVANNDNRQCNSNRNNCMEYNLMYYYNYYITDDIPYVMDYLISLKLIVPD